MPQNPRWPPHLPEFDELLAYCIALTGLGLVSLSAGHGRVVLASLALMGALIVVDWGIR
jgi:hypothetical protein